MSGIEAGKPYEDAVIDTTQDFLHYPSFGFFTFYNLASAHNQL
jgi:hypothetical protein